MINIPNYVIEWTDKYFHQSAFDVPVNYPSKKVLKFFVHFKKPDKVTLYRGVNKYNKDNREITSWTYDKKIAENYIKDGGKIMEKEFPSENILLDTTTLNTKQKKLLGYDYKIDDKEVLIII